MAFINVINPRHLSNKVLRREYKDLPQILAKILDIQKRGRSSWGMHIPLNYCSGVHHEAFFLNKTAYLLSRYSEIFLELLDRGYKLDFDHNQKVVESTKLILSEWREDWQPTPDDVLVNMCQIVDQCRMDNLNLAFIGSRETRL